MSRTSTVLGVMALSFGLSSAASATPIPLTVTMKHGQNQRIEVQNPEGTLAPDAFATKGRLETPGFVLQWSITGEPDHTLEGTFELQSYLDEQAFEIEVMMPVAAKSATTILNGAVGGSFMDGTGIGTTFRSSGNDPIYAALIDEVAVASLHPSPIELTTGSFRTTVIPPASFGSPIPVAGPPVAADVGIRLRFVLGTAAFVSLTSKFAVPEPSAWVLASTACAFLAVGLRMGRRVR